MTAGTLSWPKAGRPVAAYVMVRAQLNMSDGGPTRWPEICSGDMYAGVPTTPLVRVMAESRAREMPKSMTRGPSEPSRTLLGLKSRCTMPARWMAARAVTVPTARRCSTPPVRGPSSRTTRWRETPSTYSLTMYGDSPLRDASSTWAVQNWATRRAASTSRRKRSASIPSPSRRARSSLIATRVPSGRSAAYTTP
ncbi:hypothetical protein HNP84_007422 [Thermocatellispora tengchongensis]|uniref:Uncharacterized protein n=1 Tax=Thermocatellispora tengchongensis TaxID=1073253 RepID=A0A840PJC7_9ACTN|nr:hypothetical protein [Thermocatellispora tengchongensis]